MKITDIEIRMCRHNEPVMKDSEMRDGKKSDLEFLVITFNTDAGLSSSTFGFAGRGAEMAGEIANSIFKPFFIGRDPFNRKKMAVVNPTKGKEAITKYTVSKNYGILATELYFKLLTGRTHQIRVHFSSNKHPLVGDTTYTNSNNCDRKISLEIKKEQIINRQALHAIKLEFNHPRSEKKMSFKTNLPSDINRLRNFFSKKTIQ